MTLDTEEHRVLLLRIIENAPTQGTYQQIKEATKLIDPLIEAIQNAEVVGCEKKDNLD